MGIFKTEKVVTFVSPKTRAEVESMLSAAEAAEQPGVPQPFLDAGVQKGDYPKLEIDETLDGVWACCSCPMENGLVHFKGAHPFKHLDCVGCGHILCQNCVTSDIIAFWDEKRIILPMDRNQGELRLFQICPSCGLSHRAVKSATVDHLDRPLHWLPKAPHPYYQAELCLCSLPGDFNWPKYMIGQPYTFRMNAEQAKHECKQKLQRNKLAVSETAPTPGDIQSPRKRIDSVWERPGPRREESPDLSSPHSSLQNTPVCSPTLTAAQPRAILHKQRPDLTVNTNTCHLQRSNAVRIKSSHTPRSSSYQESPVSALRRTSRRAETWADNSHRQGSGGFESGTALYTPRSGAYPSRRMTNQPNPWSSTGYSDLCDEAEISPKCSLETNQYNELNGTAQGESLIQDAARKILGLGQPYGQYATRRDSNGQIGLDQVQHSNRPASSLTMHAPQPLRRAVTEYDLLDDGEQTHHQALSHGRKGSASNVPDEEDWKQTYLKMVKMNLVEGEKMVQQFEEDDPFRSLKWLDKNSDGKS